MTSTLTVLGVWEYFSAESQMVLGGQNGAVASCKHILAYLEWGLHSHLHRSVFGSRIQEMAIQILGPRWIDQYSLEAHTML